MSSSAIPHVIAFLTRPLLTTFPADTISTAQLILTASLASSPTASLTLTSNTPPMPIFAAAIGASIPWPVWFAALASGTESILLVYGPGYLKARVGAEPVTDVWSEDSEGSVVPIARSRVKVAAPLLHESTGVRLRATLLSARVRSMRRAQQAQAIRIPCLPTSATDYDSDSESDSGYSDSGSDRSTTSSITTAASSVPASPLKPRSLALPTPPGLVAPAAPALYRAPCPTATIMNTTPRPRLPLGRLASAPAPKRALAPAAVDPTNKSTTAYLYSGGVTRVMTGGVMLGPRPIVVASKRS
ncbi:hypothetical protein B0H15DRAFT_842843 [Mycena belliarum]|uniref:Uncharacterized protein n=1 Tax=Mycena belliarum TaxID=1033014 RepID=A0AAD6XRM4_9AGAR|nr:hypothetical protein B0H15DRAFT_842843 [Mycena belliae]